MNYILTAIIILAIIGLSLPKKKDDFTSYRVKDGQIEKSVSVLISTGAPIWEPVKRQQIVNCSGSWPDPYWTEKDYQRKKEALERCRAEYGIKNEGKLWE